MLRQDHEPILRFIVSLASLVFGLISKRFLVIDDHMIWNYRTQLERIAEHRAPLT